jgi:adenosylcobinamide-GDP ribazoletransferase
MKSLLAAVQFLTVVHFPKASVAGEMELERCVPYFPVVGLLIGIIAAALGYLLGFVLPDFPACALIVIFLIAVSGGLHMDGLADTADGFFSARPRDRILEIMKDSRTGVMGVIAVVCAVMLKFSLLVSLPFSLRFYVILLMPLAGRCALVIMMTGLSYIRSAEGLATVFVKSRSWFHVVWTALFLLIAAVLTTQWMGFAIALVTFAVTALCAGYSFRKIGGYTGDTLGAACEIVEILPAMVAVAWNHEQYAVSFAKIFS